MILGTLKTNFRQVWRPGGPFCLIFDNVSLNFAHFYYKQKCSQSMEIVSKIIPSFFQGVLGTHVSSLVWLKPLKLNKSAKKIQFFIAS